MGGKGRPEMDGQPGPCRQEVTSSDPGSLQGPLTSDPLGELLKRLPRLQAQGGSGRMSAKSHCADSGPAVGRAESPEGGEAASPGALGPQMGVCRQVRLSCLEKPPQPFPTPLPLHP